MAVLTGVKTLFNTAGAELVKKGDGRGTEGALEYKCQLGSGHVAVAFENDKIHPIQSMEILYGVAVLFIAVTLICQ